MSTSFKWTLFSLTLLMIIDIIYGSWITDAMDQAGEAASLDTDVERAAYSTAVSKFNSMVPTRKYTDAEKDDVYAEYKARYKPHSHEHWARMFNLFSARGVMPSSAQSNPNG